MINPIRIAARGLLASVFIGGGLNQLKAPAAIAPAVEAAEQQNSFFANAAIIGGLLLVALNGDGRD